MSELFRNHRCSRAVLEYLETEIGRRDGPWVGIADGESEDDSEE
jgi:hypothetical protein